jgi:hypothetical protein
LSCSSIYDVGYDYDEKADFTKFGTYDWLPIQANAEIDRLIERRIENAVNAELVAKGYKIDSDNPDFLIATNVGSRERRWREYRKTGYYGGYRGTGHRFGYRSTGYRYIEGTLVLRFMDAKSKELLWIGEAKAAQDPNYTPEKLTKLVNEAVRKILNNFPPPTAK